MALFQLYPRRRIDRRDTVAVIGLGDVAGGAEVSAVATEPWLDWFEPDTSADAGVFGWLDWPVHLSDFVGRDKDVQELVLWARSGRGVRVRWLIGPGGAGKSRLAAEVAEKLRADGWQAGFVRADQGLIVPISCAGAFLVVDAPEEQAISLDRLLADMAALETAAEQPVRILMISRSGPGDRLPASSPYARTTFDPPVRLEDPLLEGDAHIAFRSAQRRLSEVAAASRPADTLTAAPVPVSRSRFVAWYQSDPSNRMPLGSLAAAVETTLNPDRTLEDISGAGAVLALVARERARLREIARQHGFSAEGLPRLVAMAAVEGDLDHTALRRWAEPSLALGLPPRPEIVERVRRTGLLVDGVLPAPGPDLCAAGLLVTTLAEAPDRAPDWLWAALGSQLAPTLSRLARLAEDAESRLDLRRPRLAGWLAAMVVGRPERCRRLDRQIGDRWPATFTGVAVSVANTLALAATDDAERAPHYARLSEALIRHGDAEAALDAASRSLAAWRRLARTDPEAHAAGFADICHQRARALAGTSNWSGAAAAAAEAVSVRRGLAARQRSHAASYAESLGLDALCRAMTGAAQAAMAVAQDAVALARCAPAEDGPTGRFRLAVSLDQLVRVCRLSGDHGAADAWLTEADALWQWLERDAPGRFQRPCADCPV